MPHRTELISMPVSRQPVSLLAVDRAVSDMRRGRIICVYGGGGVAALCQAAEAATNESLDSLAKYSLAQPELIITARRAIVLNLAASNSVKVVSLKSVNGFTAEMIRDFADPLSDFHVAGAKGLSAVSISNVAIFGCESAAVGLAKIARLLPSAITARIENPQADDLAAWAARYDFLVVDAGDIFQYEQTAASTLRAISEASVPLLQSENTRIVAFRPSDGGLEHLAIIIGNPNPALTNKDEKNAAQPVLARIHSECFTGDLLGSLRCDCGDQLRGAIKEIAKAGGGVLLYLAQEGRGIGLVNKLRAYSLQDLGYDTMEANEQLGFDADERIYLPAAQMLLQLGFPSVRLLTNNPFKVEALSRCGIEVAERIPHAFPSNAHNELYLRAKAGRGGHLF